RYGVSVPALTKDHRGIKLNTPYPEDQYAVLEIWNEYNILEDIKRGPYSKKSPIRRIQSLDTPYQTDFQTYIPYNDCTSAAKDAKRGEESKLLALHEVIVEVLEEIESQGNNVEILDGEHDGV
ncbi:hypothetical protein Tco_0940307, partial [Tanacetum coccineum]